VALFVEFSIEFAQRYAVWSGRDDGGFASRRQRVEDSAIGLEGAIGDQQVGGHMRQQRPGQVVSACPGVSSKRRELPSASTSAWITEDARRRRKFHSDIFQTRCCPALHRPAAQATIPPSTQSIASRRRGRR